jgi:hypothetical protein
MISEEEQDRLHMLKGMYPGMKGMYSGSSYLSSKYGPFPDTWQGLAAWPAVKSVQRVYLVLCERREQGVDASSIDLEAIDSSFSAPQQQEREQGEEKEITEAQLAMGGAHSNSYGTDVCRVSKWEPRRADGLPNIPGIEMPAMLPQELQQQAEQLQGTLRDLEKKLEAVAADAARIEQDPDRPPSPAPVYVFCYTIFFLLFLL